MMYYYKTYYNFKLPVLKMIKLKHLLRTTYHGRNHCIMTQVRHFSEGGDGQPPKKSAKEAFEEK